MPPASSTAARFRELHAKGRVLVLPNAWDAGSARLIESCGAEAIATTSAGLVWSRGYRDGERVPQTVIASAVADIARVISLPLTVDVEGGYAEDADGAARTVAAVLDGGAVGINIEDGAASPDILLAKIPAIKTAAARTGIDIFVNVRTDVFLRGLVAPERALDETLARLTRYRAAGCDGVFVPGLTDAKAIRTIAAAIDAPLNVMVSPGLPPVGELEALGVRRVSAGSAIAQAAYGLARKAARQMLSQGRYEPMLTDAIAYGEMNGLLPASC